MGGDLFVATRFDLARCARNLGGYDDVADIVICEFLDEQAIVEGLSGFDVLYDPGLVDQPDRLGKLVADAGALIVRNRTQVRGGLLDNAARLRAVGRLGVGLDNIDVGDRTDCRCFGDEKGINSGWPPVWSR